MLGTKKALLIAVSGFRSGAWFLVVAALFLAAAIQAAGLGKRLALMVVVRAGSKPRRMRAGILILCFLLTLFIPAQAANAVLMTSVCLGLMQALSIKRNSNLAKGIMLTVSFGCPIAGLGVLTSGAPPIQAADLIYQAVGHHISWLEWMLYGMPFALLLGIILFWLIEWQFPVKAAEVAEGDEAIRQELASLGPLCGREKKLLIIMCGTIFLWSTGNILHQLDNTTVALLATLTIFMPGINIATWDELENSISWGTLMLFGGAISLGQSLLSTGAAVWVAENTIVSMGVVSWPTVAIIGVGGFFFMLFSLAFSGKAAAVAALVPTAIGFAQAIPESAGINVWGFTLILFYTVQVGVVMPVNTPVSMITYSTNTFSAGEMVRVGIPLCLSALACMILFSLTYWQWVGVI